MAVVIDGSNGVDIGAGSLTFPDNTTQTTAPLGDGQAWQNLTGTRAVNTEYTNLTGRPIQVMINGNFDNITLILNAVSITQSDGTAFAFLSFVVPNNHTYRLNVSAAGIVSWAELR